MDVVDHGRPDAAHVHQRGPGGRDRGPGQAPRPAGAGPQPVRRAAVRPRAHGRQHRRASATCSRTGSRDVRRSSTRSPGGGGRHRLDPKVVEATVQPARRSAPLARLTPREREVMGLIAEGRSNAAIAAACSSPARPWTSTSTASSASWTCRRTTMTTGACSRCCATWKRHRVNDHHGRSDRRTLTGRDRYVYRFPVDRDRGATGPDLREDRGLSQLDAVVAVGGHGPGDAARLLGRGGRPGRGLLLDRQQAGRQGPHGDRLGGGPSDVKIDLAFEKPFKSRNEILFQVTPAADGSRVTWTMVGPKTLGLPDDGHLQVDGPDDRPRLREGPGPPQDGLGIGLTKARTVRCGWRAPGWRRVGRRSAVPRCRRDRRRGRSASSCPGRRCSPCRSRARRRTP